VTLGVVSAEEGDRLEAGLTVLVAIFLDRLGYSTVQVETSTGSAIPYTEYYVSIQAPNPGNRRP
jgi:hypothetical protein